MAEDTVLESVDLSELERKFKANQLTMDIRMQEAQMLQLDRALALDRSRRSFGSAGDQDQLEGLYSPEDYVDVMDYRRDNYGYQAYAATFTTKTDRQDGRNWPYWVSEPELAAIRGTVRLLAAYNKTCFGVLNKLRNYVVHQGFTRKVVSKRDAPKQLLSQIETILDEFDCLNKITGDLDQEVCTRDIRDGEVGLGLWHRGGGHVDLRTVEPDQISEPTNKGQLEDWLRTERDMGLEGEECGLPFASNWSFGIHTTKGDVCNQHGYYVQWDSDPQNWDYLPGGNNPCYPPSGGVNTWMEFRKSNTDRVIKRGVSDFWPVSGDVELARKMIRNLTHAGALQAAIAWIREMAPGTTQSQVSSATMASADWQTRTTTQNGGSRTNYSQSYYPGSTLYLGAGQKFVPPPWVQQSMAAGLMGIFEGMLRSIATIWSMPEHMITGSAQNNNYACHDNKTEVLTNRGWLFWKDVRLVDKLGTMNPKTHTLEFQLPSKIHCYHHKGRMFHFVGKHNLNIMVTDRHRMLVANPRSKSWRTITAGGLAQEPYCRQIPTRVSGFTGCLPTTFVLPAVKSRYNGNNEYVTHERLFPMNVWVRFLGYWLAEGWACRIDKTSKIKARRSGHYYNVGLCQNAGPIADSIREVLSQLPGLRVRETTDIQPSGKIRYQWTINDKGLHAWLTENCGCGSANKRAPQFLHLAGTAELKPFLNALVEGDGHAVKSGSAYYFTVSKQLADDVMEFALKAGYSTGIQKQMSNGVWIVNLRVARQHQIDPRRHCHEVNYDGDVWCATVPNGLLVTRREGKLAITGNSILEAGSPFVKEVETRQGRHCNLWTAIYWKVLWFNWKCGRLRGYSWEDIRAAVEIQLTGPQVDVRDRMKETQRGIVLLDAGIISPVEMASREGVDYDEQVQLGAKRQQAIGAPGSGQQSNQGFLAPTQAPRTAESPMSGASASAASAGSTMEAWTDEAREAALEARRAKAKGKAPDTVSHDLVGAAHAWVAAQDSWRDKVETHDDVTHIKELVPNPTSEKTPATIKKYEKQILAEVAATGKLQRPFVVNKLDNGKFFLQDGNHYYIAARELAKAGKIPSSAYEKVRLVVVTPKQGYHFDLDPTLARFGMVSQTLLSDKDVRESIVASAGSTIESLDDSGHPDEYLQVLAKKASINIAGLSLAELWRGVLEEREHTGVEGSDTAVIHDEAGELKIAVAHLREDPRYYSKLKQAMESENTLQHACGVDWRNYP